MRGPPNARTIMPNAGNQNSDGVYSLRERQRGELRSLASPPHGMSTEFGFGTARIASSARIEMPSSGYAVTHRDSIVSFRS